MTTRKFFILFASIMICIIVILSSIQIVDASLIPGNTDRIMAVNPNTNKIYMTDYESPNLLVMDGSNDSVIKEIYLLPYYVNLNPKTNKVYVVTPYGIVVVDGVTDERVNLIYSEGDTNFIYGRIAINSDTNKIYVTKKLDNSVAVIDGITDIVQKEIAAEAPMWIHIDQKTNTIYVSDGGYGTTTIIDGSTDILKEVVTSEKTGARFFTAINLDTNKVYQTNPVKPGPVSVFDVNTHELIKRIEVGSFPKDIVVNPNTNKIYVSNEGDGTISVIDGNTDEVVKTFTPVINDESGQEEEKGGGCLIATATYGSELAPQVQQLRELRDNKLLQTESGTLFMNTFNDFYYSFSPYIADYERENPLFKEMVKLAITPLISSLSILNYVDMDSEESVLGYGISLIILNVMMYVGIPTVAIVGIKKRF